MSVLLFKEKGRGGGGENYPEVHRFVSLATNIDNSTSRFSVSPEAISAARPSVFKKSFGCDGRVPSVAVGLVWLSLTRFCCRN